MDNLTLTLLQSDLHWENVEENLLMFSKKIDAITEKTDIIILPEMFNTGFSMESEKLAETMNGKTVNWMKDMAQQHQAVIVGSVIIEEHEEYYNRLIWAEPEGEIYTYDKRHLFRMANEHKHFSAGNDLLVVRYKGWRICPLICYDLRFPVWSRNVDEQGNTIYDCLLYIANWPAARKAPWSKLLEARAIENQCYVVGVNRVGIDGKLIDYSGNSAVINPKGEITSNIPEGKNHTETTSISLHELNAFREKFPVEMDSDRFSII
jgi:predicted amidohydrolase